MKWFIIPIALCLTAFTPIRQQHKDLKEVDEEFSNIENTLQDQQHRVVISTPVLSDLKDGEIVIMSSSTVKLIFRNNQEIYSIDISCITVRR